MSRIRGLLFCLISLGVLAVIAALNSVPTTIYAAQAQADANSQRSGRGLLVLYQADSKQKQQFDDRADPEKPFPLEIKDQKTVQAKSEFWKLSGKPQVQSSKPATGINEAIKRSGALTVELWMTPENLKQEGPARIVTLSASPSERNLTLGQDGDKIDVRLRTTSTSTNGIPSLSTKGGILKKRLTHIVYTRDRGGKARIYLDGKVEAETTIGGSLNNWATDYRLGIGNELSGDRPWNGQIALVALYSRSLNPAEVQQNFQAGPNAETGPDPTARNPQAVLFETKIAPLLANRCLECHDPATKKGGLDLSHKATAFAESESGKTLIPGKLDKSLLWERVADNDMPAERTPLSDEEKSVLKSWIEQGATWSLETIDPALYAHGGEAGQQYIRRLTVSEYIETVRAILGVDISAEAREILPPDLRADGFSNTAYNLKVDLAHVDAYARLAELIVRKLDAEKFARQFGKKKQLTDDNMRDLIGKMGKWVLRGPLTEDEVVIYRGISTTVASAGGDFREAVSYVLEAMVQSPRFIYLIENQRGDGSPRPLDGFELANRISYIVWGGPPDEELLKAADAGKLYDRQFVTQQVERMLNDPRAKARSEQFISEWLNLNRLEHLQPDPKHFPGWKPELAEDMREETLRFFEEIVWNQKRPLSELLQAQVTFLTPRLARHYGLKPKQESFAKYDLSEVSSRGGLLTQGSVLTVGGDEASMVSRGLFVLHELLRGTVKDPPPCVDTTPVPTKAGLTQRGIAEARLKNEACGGCHARFEPLAFGLEKFDGLGTFHEQDEHGNKLREDGEILVPGTAKPIKYQSSQELMKQLAGSDRVKQSLIWKLTQFALGRSLVAEDARYLEQIERDAQSRGGTYQAAMTAIVTSDLVQQVRTENRTND